MKVIMLAVAAALIGAGNGLNAFANGEDVPETPASGGEPAAPKRGRGRPPGGSATTETTTATGPTDAERFETNRSLIKPFVEGDKEKGIEPQGPTIKNIIGKYSKTGLKDLPADKQAEFEKDIAALSY